MVPPERFEETVVLLASPPRAVRELQNFAVPTVLVFCTMLAVAAPAGASARTPPTPAPAGTTSTVTRRGPLDRPSARWAGPNRDFAHAMELVERRLIETENDDRSAFFVCALAVAWPRGPIVAVEGRVDGLITFPPRGNRGFGYDPIFTPMGGSETFGEMDPDAKHAISHRARAFEALAAALF